MDPIRECRTPPASPELSRLVTKRRCPFGESPHQSKMPVKENTNTDDNGGDVSSSGRYHKVVPAADTS